MVWHLGTDGPQPRNLYHSWPGHVQFTSHDPKPTQSIRKLIQVKYGPSMPLGWTIHTAHSRLNQIEALLTNTARWSDSQAQTVRPLGPHSLQYKTYTTLKIIKTAKLYFRPSDSDGPDSCLVSCPGQSAVHNFSPFQNSLLKRFSLTIKSDIWPHTHA